jgi:hypothetical protein
MQLHKTAAILTLNNCGKINPSRGAIRNLPEDQQVISKKEVRFK